MTKTALCLRFTGSSGAQTQMIVVTSGLIFRRYVTDDHRTRWGVGYVEGIADKLISYRADQEVTLGPTLIQISDEEAEEMSKGTFPRNVGLRFERVRKAEDGE